MTHPRVTVARQLGLPSSVQFYEVFGLDEDLLAMVSQYRQTHSDEELPAMVTTECD